MSGAGRRPAEMSRLASGPASVQAALPSAPVTLVASLLTAVVQSVPSAPPLLPAGPPKTSEIVNSGSARGSSTCTATRNASRFRSRSHTQKQKRQNCSDPRKKRTIRASGISPTRAHRPSRRRSRPKLTVVALLLSPPHPLLSRNLSSQIRKPLRHRRHRRHRCHCRHRPRRGA